MVDIIHIQNMPTNTHSHMHTHQKKHIKNNILTQDPEANSFYLKEFDVFISLCQARD